MDEYISKTKFVKLMRKKARKNFGSSAIGYIMAAAVVNDFPSADVQPLSVVAEHIKKRLYETALNQSDVVAMDAIAEMAERIDFWIDELKDGDDKKE